MKIVYDKEALIAGIGIVPWSRIGLEQWFNNYKIASLFDWDIKNNNYKGKVYSLSVDSSIAGLKHSSADLVKNTNFQKMLIGNFIDYSIFTYKPIVMPEELKNTSINFISSDKKLSANIEDKAYFRTVFSKIGVNFPDFYIFDNTNLEEAGLRLKDYISLDGEAILQDAKLSDGKGTFKLKNIDDFNNSINILQTITKPEKFVLSRIINNAHERSIQCVVTKYGVFTGPIQKQIIAHPLLANLKINNAGRFCGAEISYSDVVSDAYPIIQAQAELIGNKLQALGYKGIFGVDTLVSDDGKVYILEVNARITGVTPLLTMLYREGKDIPFYLLHVLELANINYEITDFTVEDKYSEGSLLILNSLSNDFSEINTSVQSGLYDSDLNYIKQSTGIGQNPNSILLQQYMPLKSEVKPGGRVATIFTNFAVLNNDDSLSLDAEKIVKNVTSMIKLEQL